MAARGLQYLPLRIPSKWDPVWFQQFVRDVLVPADVRNAISGPGITIEGAPNEPATISGNADVGDLLDENYVLAEASATLANSRVLAGENGILAVEDQGPGGQLRMVVVDNGIYSTKIRKSPALSVIGAPASVPAEQNVQDILASANGQVLQRLADALVFAALALSSIPVTAPGKLLGRFSAGAGGAEEITIGANLTLSGGTLDATAASPDAIDVPYSPTAPLTATNVQAALDEVAGLLALGGGLVLGLVLRFIEVSPLFTMAVTFAGNQNDGLRNFAEITFV